ncbi:10871_t:CDS:1, partial [Funneliformis caledonium]
KLQDTQKFLLQSTFGLSGCRYNNKLGDGQMIICEKQKLCTAALKNCRMSVKVIIES